MPRKEAQRYPIVPSGMSSLTRARGKPRGRAALGFLRWRMFSRTLVSSVHLVWAVVTENYKRFPLVLHNSLINVLPSSLFSGSQCYCSWLPAAARNSFIYPHCRHCRSPSIHLCILSVHVSGLVRQQAPLDTLHRVQSPLVSIDPSQWYWPGSGTVCADRKRNQLPPPHCLHFKLIRGCDPRE